jgi:hypothetical protein
MKQRFVLLASMRTGSNLLNSYLNQYDGLVCHGEAFNPTFVGLEPEYLAQLGMQRSDMKLRDADPLGFLDKIMDVDAKAVGLHMFPGHNRQVLNLLLEDSSVKKLCLRRSHFQAFVSLQIAKKTDVWRVSQRYPTKELPLDVRRMVFDPLEFEKYRNQVEGFWNGVQKVIHRPGQSFMPVWYSHLNNLKTINGIVEFLGLPERKAGLKRELEKQNPEPLKDIVENYNEMVQYAERVGLSHLL